MLDVVWWRFLVSDITSAGVYMAAVVALM